MSLILESGEEVPQRETQLITYGEAIVSLALHKGPHWLYTLVRNIYQLGLTKSCTLSKWSDKLQKGKKSTLIRWTRYHLNFFFLFRTGNLFHKEKLLSCSRKGGSAWAYFRTSVPKGNRTQAFGPDHSINIQDLYTKLVEFTNTCVFKSSTNLWLKFCITIICKAYFNMIVSN